MSHFLLQLALAPAYQVWRFRAAIALYLLILLLGSIPGARADIGQYASGLVLHSTAYAVLTYLLFSGSAGSPSARAAKAVLAVMAMGAFDEFVQSFFPYRTSDVADWLVDCGAALVVAAVLWLAWPRLAPTQT